MIHPLKKWCSSIAMLVGDAITLLKNDGVRQLGLLFPIYGKIKNGPQYMGFLSSIR